MDLTAGVLTRVLAVCCGHEPDGPEEAVLLLRQDQPSFAPTLLAAWQAEGCPLNPALDYELRVQTARLRRYRELSATLAGRVPGIVPVKGLEVADRYPDGLPRYMNDLDYVAGDEKVLWRLVSTLVDDGWDLHVATFSVFHGRLHVLVCLRRPHEDPYCLPYGVEISSYVTIGDLTGVPPVIDLPAAWSEPLVKNLMMLLFERFEQAYRARDVVDAALQFDALGTGGLPALWGEVERIGLWPEYQELVGLVRRAELPAPPEPPAARAAVAASLARRAGRRLAELRRPADAVVRHLQQRLVFGRQSGPERALWTAAQQRMSTGRALRSGLLCFGLPVGEAHDARDGLELSAVRRRGELVYVDTPVGRFLLTAGDNVDEEAVQTVAALGSRKLVSSNGSDPGGRVGPPAAPAAERVQ